MTGWIRSWVPAALVALLVAVVVGAAAWLGPRRARTDVAPSPTPSVDIHSAEAVVTAVRHYYEVEAQARRTGNGDLIDPVTTGPESLARQNFKGFIAQEAARSRRSVIVENDFADWGVVLNGDTSTATYVFRLRGHDTDAATGQPVEADMTTAREDYRIALDLRAGRWLVRERQFLGRHAG